MHPEQEETAQRLGGYVGKVAWVDLTTRSASAIPLDRIMAKMYVGGLGFGVKLLFDHTPAGVDPLGPDNLLIFAPGPLTGTAAPCASRIVLTGRSPLTGTIGMSTAGGGFPSEFKRAGFDALIVKGTASEPVYLTIRNGEIGIRSAQRLWGMSTFDCQDYIQDELGGTRHTVACIGQAGERLSLISSIISERRAMARKGFGAVMGAKRLKCIAVAGDAELTISDPAGFAATRREISRRFKTHPSLYSEFSRLGTSMTVDTTTELGVFPGRNYSSTGSYNYEEEIGAERQAVDIVRRNPCQRCPVGCTQVRIARSGEYQGTLTEGPEYETSWAFGANTGVTDLSAIYLADRLCDEYGLDTISVGSTIAFAMELLERGILTSSDVDGLDLRFGNQRAMVETIHRIAMRSGFGDLLADGVDRAARRIGGDAGYYAMNVKGLELPGYDVRGMKAMGLNYATSFTGADHNRGFAFQELSGIANPVKVDRFSLEHTAEVTKWNQVMEAAVCDCPTLCAFLLSEGLLDDTEMGLSQTITEGKLATVSTMLSSVTGLPLSAADLSLVGERVLTLARCYNIREGFGREDDYLPSRLSREPIPAGASRGSLTTTEAQDMLLDRYYEAFGYDRRGVPTLECLRRLGLEEAGAALAAAGMRPG